MPTLAEDILVTIKTKGVPNLAAIEKGMMKVGYNLRLAGRDLMRMSGSLQRLSSFLMGFQNRIIGSSDIMQDAFQDISWALEDIFEATGIIDTLADAFEWLAEIIEDNPILAWGIVLLFGIGLITMIISKVMMFGGFIKLLVGSILSARDAHLSWWQKIVMVTRALLGQSAALRQNLIWQVQVADYAARHNITFGEAVKKIENMAKGYGEVTRAQGKWTGRAKKVGKVMIAGAAVMGGMLGLFMMAEPIMEIFSAVMGVVGDAIELIISPFEDMIWQIIEFFEAHPELMAALLLAVVGAIIAMKATGFVKWLKDLLGGAAGITDKMPSMNKGMKDLGKNILYLAFAIGVLLLSMATAIWILDQTSFTLPEIITLIGALTAAVVTLGGAFSVFTIMIAAAGATGVSLLPILGPLAVLLLAVGAAAFLVGAGFFLAGAGIKLASEGIMSMVSSLPQVLLLVVALFALVSALGAIALVAFPAMFGILGLAAAVSALAAALILLSVPLAIIKGLGGTPAVLEMLKKIPSFQGGAMITGGGLAVVHEKEMITPAKGAPLRGARYTPKEPPMTVSVDVSGAGSMQEIIERAVEASVSQVSEQMERKYRRSEY